QLSSPSVRGVLVNSAQGPVILFSERPLRAIAEEWMQRSNCFCSQRSYDVRSHELIRKMMTPFSIGPSSASRTAFEREGFLGPLPVLTARQCELLVRHLTRGAYA